MKKILLGAVALAAFGAMAPASAADLAARPYTKAPPPMIAAIYDWSGFYIGLNGGVGWSHKCWDLLQVGVTVISPGFGEGCHDASGGTVGGQIGYRWQAASWVFGLEAQGNWADFKGSNTSLFDPLTRNQSKLDAFGLFTGQVGYAWNSALLYVKGGAAVTSNKYAGIDTGTGLAFDSANQTRWGATVGVGLEYGFAPNWSVGVEYNHLFMGDRDIVMVGTGTLFPAGASIRTDRISQ